MVDNSFNSESKLHIANDYYTYGGMIRPVGIEFISEVYISRIQFTPSREDGKWKGNIDVFVTNAGGNQTEVELKGALGGASLSLGAKSVAAGGTVAFHATEAFPNVQA